MTNKCPNCDNPVLDTAQFCPNCGITIEEERIPCSNCGAMNSRLDKFCRGCGRKVVFAEEGEDLDRDSTFAPLNLGVEEELAGTKDESLVKVVDGRRVGYVPDTDELVEELDKKGDIEGLRLMAGTFKENLRQLFSTNNELERINDRIATAIEIHRGINERKLKEVSANYLIARKKIAVLEDLSALKKLQKQGTSLYQYFGGTEPIMTPEQPVIPAPTPLASLPEMEDFPAEPENLEDFEESADSLDELTDLPDDDEELIDDDDEFSDDSGESWEELPEDEEELKPCGSCGQPVPGRASSCPNCGAEFAD